MILVSFCCNDPDNGNPTGKVTAIELHGEDVGITLESRTLEGNVFRGLPRQASAPDRCDCAVQVGRKVYDAYGYKEWFGNWCWDAVRMPSVEARRLVLELRAMGWQCTEAECAFHEAFAAGAPLTHEMLCFALSDEPSPGVVA